MTQTISIDFTRKELDVIDTARLLYENKKKKLNTLPEFIKLLTLKLSVDFINGDMADLKIKHIYNSYQPFMNAKMQRKKRIALFVNAISKEIKYQPELILKEVKQAETDKIEKKRLDDIEKAKIREYKKIRFVCFDKGEVNHPPLIEAGA